MQCHFVKNTLLHTVFSANLPAGIMKIGEGFPTYGKLTFYSTSNVDPYFSLIQKDMLTLNRTKSFVCSLSNRSLDSQTMLTEAYLGHFLRGSQNLFSCFIINLPRFFPDFNLNIFLTSTVKISPTLSSPLLPCVVWTFN